MIYSKFQVSRELTSTIRKSSEQRRAIFELRSIVCEKGSKFCKHCKSPPQTYKTETWPKCFRAEPSEHKGSVLCVHYSGRSHRENHLQLKIKECYYKPNQFDKTFPIFPQYK